MLYLLFCFSLPLCISSEEFGDKSQLSAESKAIVDAVLGGQLLGRSFDGFSGFPFHPLPPQRLPQGLGNPFPGRRPLPSTINTVFSNAAHLRGGLRPGPNIFNLPPRPQTPFQSNLKIHQVNPNQGSNLNKLPITAASENSNRRPHPVPNNPSLLPNNREPQHQQAVVSGHSILPSSYHRGAQTDSSSLNTATSSISSSFNVASSVGNPPNAVSSNNSPFNAASTSNNSPFNADSPLNNSPFNAASSSNLQYNAASLSNNSPFNAASSSNNQQYNTASLSNNSPFNAASSSNNQQYNTASLSNNSPFNAASSSNNQQYNTASLSNNSPFNSVSSSNNLQYDAASLSNNSPFNSVSSSNNLQYNAASFSNNFPLNSAFSSNNQFIAGATSTSSSQNAGSSSFGSSQNAASPSISSSHNVASPIGSYSRIPQIHTGFTPIFTGSSNQEIRVLASNTENSLQNVEGHSLATSNSESQPVFAAPSAGSSAPQSSSSLLTAVPADRLAKARQANFSYVHPNHSPGSPFVPSSVSTSTRVSTRVVSSSASDILKASSSIQEAKLAAKKAYDLNCDGSRDLGWCDLGDKYPRSLVQQMMTVCTDLVARMYVEIPHSFEDLTDTSHFSGQHENVSSRAAKERGNHDSWSWASYFTQKGALCDAERGFLRPEAAKDTTGNWNIIVQTDALRQRVPIEMCRKANSSCKKMVDCGLKSQCLQKFNYHLLLSLDPNQIHGCPFMKLYRFPSACVCHVE